MFRFPYDTQICHVEFGTVMETEITVNVSLNQEYGFLLGFYSPSNEFTLKSAQTYRKSWKVSKKETVWWQVTYKNPVFELKGQYTIQNHIRKDYQIMIRRM